MIVEARSFSHIFLRPPVGHAEAEGRVDVQMQTRTIDKPTMNSLHATRSASKAHTTLGK